MGVMRIGYNNQIPKLLCSQFAPIVGLKSLFVPIAELVLALWLMIGAGMDSLQYVKQRLKLSSGCSLKRTGPTYIP